METKKINQSTVINATKEKVWDVLLKDEYTRIWYAEFSPGSKAETDWQEGGKALFTDHTGNGMVTKVVVNKPGKELIIEYTGLVKQGEEDYESEGAKAVQGGRESYRLSEDAGVTRLETSADMSEDMYDMMWAAWEKALQKIKELAEAEAI